MQINSASSYTPQTPTSVVGGEQTRIDPQGERLATLPEQNNQQQATQSQRQSQQQTRFDVDEQSIALVEQLQAQQQQSGLSNEQQNTQPANTGYDQPSQANQTAVSAYQSVGSIAQREVIQQTFGVDLYV